MQGFDLAFAMSGPQVFRSSVKRAPPHKGYYCGEAYYCDGFSERTAMLCRMLKKGNSPRDGGIFTGAEYRVLY